MDFTLWRRAFDSFAEARDTAGVLRHRVMRPIDDEHYVAVDLDFPTAEAAAAFERFLRTTVWADPQRSPALVGSQSTRIFETDDT